MIFKIIVILHLLFLNSIYAYGSGEPEWNWVRPKPTGNDLTSIKFINSTTGFACGNNGDVIKTTDGGSNWTLLNTPTRNRLNGIYATQSGKVIVAGDSSTLLQSSDFGNSWNPIQIISSNVTMTSVKIVNDSVAYACGFTGTIIYQTHIYKTTNGGTSWHILPGNLGFTVYSVNFYSENYGVVSGGNATYITHNGGQTWTSQSIAYVLIAAGKCITFRDSLNIGITFASSTMRTFVTTSNGGQNWVKYEVGLPNIGSSGDVIEGHTFVNENTGYLVSRFGRIMKTTNGGVNWNLQETHTNLWWVESLSEDFVIACGYGGTILKSTDEGNTWSKLMGGYQPLNHLVFVNQSTGFACGNRGSIIKTTDVGETWQDLNSGVTVKLNQLHFINETTGYCVGDTGTFLKTTNAGDTWEVQNSGTNLEIYSVYFHNEQTGLISPMGSIQVTTNGGNSWQSQFFFTFARFKNLYFVNETTGIAANGYLYRTMNGGVNWNTVYDDDDYYSNLFFIDNENAFYLKRLKILKTSNTGLSWNVTPNDLQINPVNIYFGSEYIGLASHGLASFVNGMSKTTDGGVTWLSYPTVSANINNWITFINANTGIAVDGRGCIIKTTNEIITNVETVSNILPDKIELFQNYPNPFNPSTTIRFDIPQASNVKLIVFDALGRQIASLVNEQLAAGSYNYQFSPNKSGQAIDDYQLGSGVYFYRLSAGDFSVTKRMVIIK